ncbi:Hypothetical predicted protein, partial [Pelobates cultripes]
LPPTVPECYAAIQLFTDLSSATLSKRDTFGPITKELRDAYILYRWGFPTHFLILHNGTDHRIFKLKEGRKLPSEWSIPGLCSIYTQLPRHGKTLQRKSPETGLRSQQLSDTKSHSYYLEAYH